MYGSGNDDNAATTNDEITTTVADDDDDDKMRMEQGENGEVSFVVCFFYFPFFILY